MKMVANGLSKLLIIVNFEVFVKMMKVKDKKRFFSLDRKGKRTERNILAI